MRVQGGTRGILTAIAAGRLDELSPDLPEPIHTAPMSAKEQRRIRLIEERRVAAYQARFGATKQSPF